MKWILAATLFCSTAVGQLISVIGFSPYALTPEMKTFLSLTDAQASQVDKLNSDFYSWSRDRYFEQLQLQAAISAELANDNPDPGLIGLKSVEVAKIQRSVRTELDRVRKLILAVLTPAQQEKVKLLDQARQMQALVTQAECSNLLASNNVTTPPLTGLLLGTPTAVVSSAAYGCGVGSFGLLPNPFRTDTPAAQSR